ncbi:MAG: hypothetical protein J6V54_07360 [Bacteroidales bacterium]|nr:hypothetical protein [Bacteroidales bacterium]
MLELLTPQRPWGGFPTPLGDYPNGVGVYSQRRWEGFPRALGNHAVKHRISSAQRAEVGN